MLLSCCIFNQLLYTYSHPTSSKPLKLLYLFISGIISNAGAGGSCNDVDAVSPSVLRLCSPALCQQNHERTDYSEHFS